MNINTENKKETYIKCVKCNDEIFCNTHKVLTHCNCGAIWVDGCEDYIRVGGNKEDHIEIQK
jgi:methylthioribose-1-phosphate isomerase